MTLAMIFSINMMNGTGGSEKRRQKHMLKYNGVEGILYSC